MNSIIHQLQAEALDPKIKVSDLLRKAKVVAVKLELKDFLTWIEKELNGYDAKSNDALPLYRVVGGETKAWNPYHGWVPVLFSDPKSQNALSERGVVQPIGELDDIIQSKRDGSLQMNFDAEAKNIIGKAVDFQTDFKFMLEYSAVAGILDAVRNTVLDWSLKLEKEGVIGKGVAFSKTEIEKAKSPQAIYNINHIEHFAGTMGAVGAGANVHVTQLNADTKEKLQGLLEQIKKYAPNIDIDESKRPELTKNISELDAEVKSGSISPSKTKFLLGSIASILEGAAGNVAAAGIILAIQKIVGV
jgi:hypothetical protein